MIKLGLDCKLYRGEAGENPEILMVNVKDVTLGLSTGTADITTRAAQGWRVSVATLKEGTISTSMLYDPDDADFAAVNDCFLHNKPLALFVSDGEGSGLLADFVVSQFEQTQNLEEGVGVSVTFNPTLVNRAPRYIVAGESDSSSSN